MRPKCRGETRRRACPKCHTALSIDFVDTKNPMLGLVGSKGSGKTVLMTVLVKQLRKVVGQRFDADIGIATDNPDGITGISRLHEGPRAGRCTRTGTLPQRHRRRSSADGRHSASCCAGEPAANPRCSPSSTARARTSPPVRACPRSATCMPASTSSSPSTRSRCRAREPAQPAAAGDASTTDNAAFHALEQVTQQLRTHHQLRPEEVDLHRVAFVFTKIDAFFPTLDRRQSR